ncbi:MAG: reverse transcriptase domain-containing protein, partial [Pirellulaceae bacterium]
MLGVREAAQKDKKLKFTSLLHHLTPELLRASFFDLKKQAAPGVDDETWHDYARDFERRIDDLHGRIHRGAYRAKPSKRTYIPKADGKMRPLGIAALEDKIVQQAARTVLECIYEQDFLGFSYGFRPGRSPHRALDALYVGVTNRKVNWIIDADIRGFFDNISHGGGKGGRNRCLPSAPVWTWTYGSNSLISRMTDPLSRYTDYGYDAYGRQATVTNHEGYVTSTVHNMLDQPTSVTTPDPDGTGGVTASVTTYAYDYMNRLASITDPLGTITSKTWFTYDLMGRLINLRDPVNNDTSWAFDNAGRVTMETNELNNTRSFYHDAAGNLTRKKDRNERVTQYTFDDLDRMTAEKWLTSGDPVPTIAISTT